MSVLSRLALLSLFAIALPLYSQAFQPGGPWTVVDANGKVLGEYLGNNQSLHVVSMVFNGTLVSMYAQRPLLTGTSTLYYDQANCQGSAFLTLSYDLAGPTAILADGTVMYGDPSSPKTQRTGFSFLTSGGCFNQTSTFSETVAPLQGPNVKQLFTAPFAVRQSALAAPMISHSTLALLALGMVVIALIALRPR